MAILIYSLKFPTVRSVDDNNNRLKTYVPFCKLGYTISMTVNNYKTDQIKDLLKTVFKNNSQVLFAYLFGSYARQEATPLSDIDIAIYVKDSNLFSFNDKLAIHADCCRALNVNDVDIVVLNQTRNLILQDEIIRQGKLIYLNDKKAYDDYELKTLHLSCDFKWQRKMEIGL